MTNLIVSITGPSSSGKTVLSNILQKNGMVPLISTTTRPPRVNEKNGVDYHFISEKEFLEKLDKGEFIEHVTYDNQRYGICVDEAKRAFSKGKPAVLVAEPEGVQQIYEFAKKRGWDTLKVFVYNPLNVLMERMLDRFHNDTKGIDETDEKYTKAKKSHGQRILKVLDFEQKNWVEPAISKDSSYNLVFDSFDPQSQENVVDSILHAVYEITKKNIMGEPNIKPRKPL